MVRTQAAFVIAALLAVPTNALQRTERNTPGKEYSGAGGTFRTRDQLNAEIHESLMAQRDKVERRGGHQAFTIHREWNKQNRRDMRRDKEGLFVKVNGVSKKPESPAGNRTVPNMLLQKKGDDDYYYNMGGYYYDSPFGSSSSVNSSGLHPDWQRPFNMINGACEKSESGGRTVIELHNIGGGAYYLGKLGVGSPEQPINMILDTGSDGIVLKSNSCKGCDGPGFANKDSSSYAIDLMGPDAGKEYFEYGSGAVLVQHFKDFVHAGPNKGKMNMMEILETDIEFMQDTDDTIALQAIVGMAPGLQEYVGERMASAMNVRHFSECLPQNSNENGFFVVNEDDPSKNEKFKGPFPNAGEYYWSLDVTGFRLRYPAGSTMPAIPKKKKDRTLSDGRFAAIIDTGTTLLSLPTDIVEELKEHMDNENWDCSRMSSLPTLAFEIGGVTHTLPPSSYVAEYAEDVGFHQKIGKKAHKKVEITPSMRAMMYFHKEGSKQFVNSRTGTQCMLLFTDPMDTTSQDGKEIAILGMPFFRQYEVAFDFCTREMYTSLSQGDCSHHTGSHPSNVNFCEDKDWMSCWLSGLWGFFVELWEGIIAVFSNGEAAPAKPIETMRLNPKAVRISTVTKWLLNMKKSLHGGSVSI